MQTRSKLEFIRHVNISEIVQLLEDIALVTPDHTPVRVHLLLLHIADPGRGGAPHAANAILALQVELVGVVGHPGGDLHALVGVPELSGARLLVVALLGQAGHLAQALALKAGSREEFAQFVCVKVPEKRASKDRSLVIFYVGLTCMGSRDFHLGPRSP